MIKVCIFNKSNDVGGNSCAQGWLHCCSIGPCEIITELHSRRGMPERNADYYCDMWTRLHIILSTGGQITLQLSSL